MKEATLKDIAQELNLAVSTVSRALRDHFDIGEDTKQLVRACASRLHYQPNPFARSLRGKSRAVGVIVPQLDNPYFAQVINGMDEVASEHGYDLCVFQSHESYSREVTCLSQALARRVDGVLISLSSETTDVGHLREFQQQGKVLVQFDRVSDQLAGCRVVTDNFTGALAATTHLLDTGRRRIAHVAMQPWLSITQERLAGYRRALEQYGVTYDEQLVRYESTHLTGISHLVDELFALSPRPDAFFTTSDHLAVACLAALRQRSIHVPEQVALIGFTNLVEADLLAPALSTVTQPATEIGQEAARRLIYLIEHKRQTKPASTIITIPTSLSIRQSTQQQPSFFANVAGNVTAD